jgi:penicillin-binding protein 1A
VAAVWIGFDTPRSLGDKETGGSLSLPVWINFMETALKGVPVVEPSAPEGVINIAGEWYYEEFARGGGVSNVGGASPDSGGGGAAPAAPGSPPYDKSLMNSDGLPPPSRPQPSGDDRKSILDLFRN